MKISVYVGTSLDGFIARKDGDIGWLEPFQNKEVGDSYAEFISNIDAIVLGRGTFEKVLDFPSWPYEKKVFVLSSRMKRIPDRVSGKATLLSVKPGELLKYLAGEGLSNIYVDGGKVIQGFLQEDFVDEVTITQVPVLIGSGIPLFGFLGRDLQFRHLRTNVYSNGLVSSRYERSRL